MAETTDHPPAPQLATIGGGAGSGGTGKGGAYPEAVVGTLDITCKRRADDFAEEVDGRTQRTSPWTDVLVSLVNTVNSRGGDGQRLLQLGEFLKVGIFQSKYGARNRAAKMAAGGWKGVPEVEGYHFEFKTQSIKYTPGQGGGWYSELWAALVADSQVTS